MAKKQPYIVLSQDSIFSKYGGRVYRIKMVGVMDRQEYITYVDPKNENFDNWRHITRSPEHGFILNNLKEKTNKAGVINADSRVIIEEEVTDPSVIMNELYEIWREQDEKNNAITFRQIRDGNNSTQ